MSEPVTAKEAAAREAAIRSGSHPWDHPKNDYIDGRPGHIVVWHGYAFRLNNADRAAFQVLIVQDHAAGSHVTTAVDAWAPPKTAQQIDELDRPI